MSSVVLAAQVVKQWCLGWEGRLRKEGAVCELELRAGTSASGMSALQARARELYGSAACTQTCDTVVTFRNGVRVVAPRAGPDKDANELFELAIVERKECLNREQINLPFGQRRARMALSEESRMHGSDAAAYAEAAKQHLARLRADQVPVTLPRATMEGCSVFLGTGVEGETHTSCGTELMDFARARWDELKWTLCSRTPAQRYASLPFGNLPFCAFVVVIEDDEDSDDGNSDNDVLVQHSAVVQTGDHNVAVGHAARSAPYTDNSHHQQQQRQQPQQRPRSSIHAAGVCSVRARNRTTFRLPRGLMVELTCVLAGSSSEATYEVEVEAVALQAGNFPKLEQFKEACFALSTLLNLRPLGPCVPPASPPQSAAL